ncbi:hypothetical protein J3T91_05605 [Bifidobacterium sp. B4001]|uniref:hypothetical protein n=1 Tax=unclassified Bifidobacterium TaxID=2608897 RepID=UPI00226BA79A|nr:MULTISPECIES: hypothetical protein [unclassified Bifidobacterium]MCX8672988.1 hypothetical protein [Bifidobacterium sp. B4079]MCX8681421.1 hypothetical protein [Bifidobacterium sp. B4001]
MSDMAFPAHTLACDWPECEETAHQDGYSSWESYDSAVTVFADPDNGGEWLHTDGKDYCPKHWHWDDEHGRAPGPEPEEEA